MSEKTLCRDEPDGFKGVISCTLPLGHDGRHEQRGDTSIARWPVEADDSARDALDAQGLHDSPGSDL